jgi:hypothetical protein
VRPPDTRDPGATHVLAFHERLAARGCDVNELNITRRLN